MPRYKVDAPGFYEGRLYDPNGKRKFLNVDKPFTKKNKKPSWVSDMPQESEVVRLKREAQEASQLAADAEKAEQDEKDINEASFLGDGEKAADNGPSDDIIENI